MRIRNIEFDFDLLDADDIEKFEKEAQKVAEKCKNKEKKEMSYSEIIREECSIINEFFDNVFGDGASEKIFKGKQNLGEHIKAFEDIVNEKMAQQRELNNTFERYQPNREQRRYNQFNKRKK